jgi:hypothetical protein
MTGVTRSIAQSDQLTQLLDSATERLPAPPARPRRLVGRHALAALLLLLGAAIVALGVARSWGTPPQGRSVAPPAAPRSPIKLAPASASQPTPPEESAVAGAVPRAPAALVPSTEAPKPWAYLSINALPWAELRLDDRPLGTTPKRGLPVPPGAHVLSFSCPALDRQARVPLQLAAGKRYRVVVDLQVSPPSIAIH